MLQGGIISSLLFIVILLASVIIHEIAHGFAALSLGDSTAHHAGRLSINPIKHIDLVGSIIVPGFLVLVGSPLLFGWAKPVPINPRNLRGKYDELLVALAGPFSNLLFAAIAALALTLVPLSELASGIVVQVIMMNCVLAIFNLIPIPPLDGYHVLMNIPGKIFRQIGTFIGQYQLVGIILILLIGQYIISTPALVLSRLLINGITI
jgi:Zn-dependent protease